MPARVPWIYQLPFPPPKLCVRAALIPLNFDLAGAGQFGNGPREGFMFIEIRNFTIKSPRPRSLFK